MPITVGVVEQATVKVLNGIVDEERRNGGKEDGWEDLGSANEGRQTWLCTLCVGVWRSRRHLAVSALRKSRPQSAGQSYVNSHIKFPQHFKNTPKQHSSSLLQHPDHFLVYLFLCLAVYSYVAGLD